MPTDCFCNSVWTAKPNSICCRSDAEWRPPAVIGDDCSHFVELRSRFCFSFHPTTHNDIRFTFSSQSYFCFCPQKNLKFIRRLPELSARSPFILWCPTLQCDLEEHATRSFASTIGSALLNVFNGRHFSWRRSCWYWQPSEYPTVRLLVCERPEKIVWSRWRKSETNSPWRRWLSVALFAATSAAKFGKSSTSEKCRPFSFESDLSMQW